MPYLLMNGSTTENLNIYIKDLLFLHFKSLPSEIPFNENLGIKRYVLEDSIVQYVDKVREEVNGFLESVNNRHNSRLSINQVETIENSKLKISIDLEDVGVEDYVIPIVRL